MPRILIENLYNKEIFTLNEKDTLLNIIHANYVDWMHACGGKGRCTTCKAIVIEGMEHLSELTPAEQKFQNMDRLKSDERLACQCLVFKDITVRVADENKFLHLDYSD